MFDSCLVQEFLHEVLSTSLMSPINEWKGGDESPIRGLGASELTLGTLEPRP